MNGPQKLVRETSPLPLGEMKQGFLDRVAAWRAGPSHDDISLVPSNPLTRVSIMVAPTILSVHDRRGIIGLRSPRRKQRDGCLGEKSIRFAVHESISFAGGSVSLFFFFLKKKKARERAWP